MITKYMEVTRINLLDKIWCNIKKNDQMMAPYDSIQKNNKVAFQMS
jgi:hypothetical protein